MKKIAYILFLLIVTILTSCSDDNPAPDNENKEWEEYTVAVVLPQERGLSTHWERCLGLFADNFKSAFHNQGKGVKLKFEYYDELNRDLSNLALTLADRDDVYAVIGGLYSSSTRILASKICMSGKPLFTLATCEELVRAYASTGRLWAMTETDITQCEVLLSKVINYGGKSVALIAKDNDDYGKTFIDWFSFQAKELGLENKGMYRYSTTDLNSVAFAAMTSGADYLICVPSDISDISPILNAHNEQQNSDGNVPKLLFSDTAYGVDVLNLLGISAEGIEGVSFGANPESGFDVSYRTYFGSNPTSGEAQLYDAAMLIGYTAWYQMQNPEELFMGSLRKIVSGTEINMGSWMGEDMRLVVDALASGSFPTVRGASGAMTFDAKVFTNVLNTTYYNYKVYNGQYIILDYNTSDGGNRTDATLAGWNWKASQIQDFADPGSFTYPEHKGNKALLVASSAGWENYRHQADVLAIYQLLKLYGYNDNSIILIAEDDIAYNPANTNPGVIQVTRGGDNVHKNAQIDYKMSDLRSEDILNILTGNKTSRTPTVIESTENDNIFVFWSGHGTHGGICYNDELFALTGSNLSAALHRMADKKCFRKLLMMVEACFSGGVMEQCTGIPGMLFITAANGDETSKADVFNEDLKVWMSNRFTSTFIEQITADRNIAMRDLYYRLFINTVGSHVMVYNDDNYGNLYKASMTEFINSK
ncbi:MAG: C13 family peptidase [Muribaculaceae bacterium]